MPERSKVKSNFDSMHGALIVIAIVLVLYIGIPIISGHSTFFITKDMCIDRDNDSYGVYGLAKCAHVYSLDCDDTKDYINPGASDFCGIDANCDGRITSYANCPVCFDIDKKNNPEIASNIEGMWNGERFYFADKCISGLKLNEAVCRDVGFAGSMPVYEEVNCAERNATCAVDSFGKGRCRPLMFNFKQ